MDLRHEDVGHLDTQSHELFLIKPFPIPRLDQEFVLEAAVDSLVAKLLQDCLFDFEFLIKNAALDQEKAPDSEEGMI